MSSAFYVTTNVTGTTLQVIVNAVAGSSIESADLAVSYLATTGTFTGATGPSGWSTVANVGNGKISMIDAALTAPVATAADGVLVTLNFTLPSIGAVVQGTVTVNDYSNSAGSGFGASPSNTLAAAACFATGTRIAVPGGAVRVEALQTGDAVLTASGAVRPIVWIGRREVDIARHPEPDSVRPIRIQANAVAPGQPVDDLLLSPDHALLIDGMLIGAHALVNGGSIAPETMDHVGYWHVELETHDIILAEGVPVESYLDTGHRDSFEGITMRLHPVFIDLGHAAVPVFPYVTDPERVEPIWQRLTDRATASSLQPSTDEPDVALIASGRRIVPSTDGSGRHVFAVPAGTRQATLVSRTARPSDRMPWCGDRRLLGVAVGFVQVDGVAVALETLSDGWHAAEHNDGQRWRWTNGAAAISLPGHAAVLDVTITATLPYARAAA